MLGRGPSRALRLAIGFFSAFVVISVCLAIWEFLTGLILRFPALGWLAVALLVGACVATLWLVGKEILALRRLTRINQIQQWACARAGLGCCPRRSLFVPSLRLSTVAGRSCVGRWHDLWSQN